MPGRRSTLVCALLAMLCSGFEWEGRWTRVARDFPAAPTAERRDLVRRAATSESPAARSLVLAALGDPDPLVRREAMAAAASLGLREAIPTLVDRADGEEAPTRAAALAALAALEAPEAYAIAIRALGDAEASVRIAAVRALRSSPTPEARTALVGRLEDPDAAARAEAANALGASADPAAALPLATRLEDEAPEVRIAAVEALAGLDDPAASAGLADALDDDSEAVRLAALGAIARRRDASLLEAIRPFFASDAQRVARAAVAAALRIDAPRVLPELERALLSPITRETVVAGIVEAALGEPVDAASARTLGVLCTMLSRAGSTESATVLAYALGRALAERPAPFVASALVEAGTRASVKPAVLFPALGFSGGEAAFLPLLAAASSPDADDRIVARRALATLLDRTGPDGRVADPLLAILPRAPEDERPLLVDLLGRSGATRAAPELATHVASPDEPTRLAAIEALGRIGSDAADPALLRALASSHAATRLAAAEALGRTAGSRTVSALLDRLASPEPTDRHAVLIALGPSLARLAATGGLPEELSRRASDDLLAVVRGPEPDLASRALDAATRWATDAGFLVVHAALAAHDPALRTQATLALGAFDRDDARSLRREALRSDEASIRLAAAAATGEHGDATEASALVDMLGASTFPTTLGASSALARLAARGRLASEHAATICEHLTSREPIVRANLLVALRAIEPAHECAARHALETRRDLPSVVRAALVRLERAANRDADLRRLCDGAASPSVVAACAEVAAPREGEPLALVAYDAEGRSPLRERVVGLVLADGSVVIVPTTRNATVALANAPRGQVTLLDPSLPLGLP
ncbi:MAG: HEAT repeat domain-containing protein [Polyangiales bacterium]